MDIHELTSFRKMITPTVIHILFWIGLVATVLGGLISVIAGLANRGGGGAVLGGLFMMILGPILVRVYCELLIVFFRILDVLVEIRDQRATPPVGQTPPTPPTTV